MNSLIRPNVDVRSAIINCVCPECGGAIELDFDEFRCVGRCGKDWRPFWERKHYNGDSQTRRDSHLQSRKRRR